MPTWRKFLPLQEWKPRKNSYILGNGNPEKVFYILGGDLPENQNFFILFFTKKQSFLNQNTFL